MTDKELTLKLDRARWWTISTPKAVFYGQLMARLADRLKNPHGKTACTDGAHIMWDKSFLGKLTDEETRFVLLHETLHCAHQHLWRFPAGACDHSVANQACDHAINLLLNGGFGADVAMPKGGLADSQFQGMAEEEIYAALANQPKQGKPQAGQGSGDDDPCGDYCAPADDGQPGNQYGKPQAGQGNGYDDRQTGAGDSLSEKWQRAVIQAAQAAKASGQGNVPGDMQRILDDVLTVRIDWRRETADFVRNAASSRNDWTRSPRRHAWQSVVYPSRRQNEIGWIIGVRDTSGSIDATLAAEFSALLAQACAELNCGLVLIDCDAAIQAEYRIEPGMDVPRVAKGGGGTDFAAPFVRADELIDAGEKIAGLVYFTDLCGSNWPADEAIPTLCLSTTDSIAPSGRTVRIL